MLRIQGALFVYSPLFKKSLTKRASLGGLNRGSNLLQGKSTVTGVILLLLLEADIFVRYCYLDILVQ